MQFPPAYVSLLGIIIAALGLLTCFFCSFLLDHSPKLFPFVSQLAVSPPESSIATFFGVWYSVIKVLSDWLWFARISLETPKRGYMFIYQGLMLIIFFLSNFSGLTIFLLWCINTEEDNHLHYRLCMTSFMCYVVIIPSAAFITFYHLCLGFRFLIFRMLISMQGLTGIYLFVYYNYLGLKIQTREIDLYQEWKDGELGIYLYSAMGEWMTVTALLEYCLLVTTELRGYLVTVPTSHENSFPASYPTLGATAIATLSLLTSYLIICLLDHTDILLPFVSSFGVFPPESSLMTLCGVSFSILNFSGQLLWCARMRLELEHQKGGFIPSLLVYAIGFISAVAAVMFFTLWCINMEEDNQLHYICSIRSFYCYLIMMPLSALLTVYHLGLGLKYFIPRAVLSLQGLFGIIVFVYYNYRGLETYVGHDNYHRYKDDGAYYEYMICAFGEWMVIAALLEHCLLIAIELDGYHFTIPKVIHVGDHQPKKCYRK